MGEDVFGVDHWHLGGLEVNTERSAWDWADLWDLGEEIVDDVLNDALKNVRDEE